MIKYLRWFPVVAVAFVISASAAFASTTTPLLSREAYTVGQGDLLTKFSSDPVIMRGDLKDETWNLSMGANYFLTDIFAPGLEFNIDVGNGKIVQFLPNVRAYWPGLGRWLPYGLLGVGYAHILGNDGFNLALGPGVDFMLSNTVAIGFAFRYDLAVGDGTVHLIRFPLGFNIYFKL